jgi:hypothetical protein
MVPAKRRHLIAAAMVVSLWMTVLAYGNMSTMSEIFQSDNIRDTAVSFKESLKSFHAIETAPVIQPDKHSPKEKQISAPGGPIPRQIGMARKTDQSPDPEVFKKILKWRPVQDGGHTAAIIVYSPEARALRAGMIVGNLPRTTEFRFFEITSRPGEGAVTKVTGKQIHRLLRQNRTKAPDHPDAGTYWSPMVAGEKMGVEIYLPPGVHPGGLGIAIPYISHIYALPGFPDGDPPSLQNYGDSNPCQNDATCYSGWEVQRNAVAKIVFVEQGYSYICTGTLLNDTDTASQIPYFVTANHCIDSQPVASTLETHWFFESAACGSGTRHTAYTVKSGGSDLLWTRGLSRNSLDANQDLTLLRLNDTPPDGAMLAGWNTFIDQQQMTGIHHPSGDWKKISFGNPDDTYKCYDIDGDSYHCVTSATGSFLRVLWTDGGTEGGSSGSGLFNTQGQLVGTLLGGGGGDCAGSDSEYSRFGAAYDAGDLAQWLAPSPPVLGTVILTRDIPDVTLPAGSDAVVYGTFQANQVVLESGAKAELINFPGQNTIQIQSDSSRFSVSRSGTVVLFEGSDGTRLKIPASAEVQTIAFSDRVMTLTIHTGQVLLDDQVITEAALPVD